MQSSARRSYKAVVMPTDALLTLGILKLTSRIVNGDGWERSEGGSGGGGGGGKVRATKISLFCVRVRLHSNGPSIPVPTGRNRIKYE